MEIEEERQNQNGAGLQPETGPEKKAPVECNEKAKEMVLRFNDLVEEGKHLKVIFETILPIRVVIRDFPGCKRLDENLKEAQISIEQRVPEITALLKALDKEAKGIWDFLKQTPEGHVQ